MRPGRRSLSQAPAAWQRKAFFSFILAPPHTHWGETSSRKTPRLAGPRTPDSTERPAHPFVLSRVQWWAEQPNHGIKVAWTRGGQDQEAGTLWALRGHPLQAIEPSSHRATGPSPTGSGPGPRRPRSTRPPSPGTSILEKMGAVHPGFSLALSGIPQIEPCAIPAAPRGDQNLSHRNPARQRVTKKRHPRFAGFHSAVESRRAPEQMPIGRARLDAPALPTPHLAVPASYPFPSQGNVGPWRSSSLRRSTRAPTRPRARPVTSITPRPQPPSLNDPHPPMPHGAMSRTSRKIAPALMRQLSRVCNGHSARPCFYDATLSHSNAADPYAMAPSDGKTVS